MLGSGTFGVAVYHIARSSCSRLSTSIHADRDTSAILLQTRSSTSSGEAHALRSHRAKTRRAISRYRNGASQRALTGSEAPFRGWPAGGSPSNISRTMGVGNQHQSRKRTGTDVKERLRNTGRQFRMKENDLAFSRCSQGMYKGLWEPAREASQRLCWSGRCPPGGGLPPLLAPGCHLAMLSPGGTSERNAARPGECRHA